MAEQVQQQQEEQTEGFDGAFAQAVGVEPEEEPAEEAGGEEGGEEETESDEAGEEPEQSEPEPASDKLSFDELHDRIVNGQATEAERKDYDHRVRSWQGTLSSKDRKLQEMQRRLEEAEASQQGSQKPEQEGGQGDADSTQQVQQFKEYLSEEFGPETAERLMNFVDQRAQEIAAEQFGQVDQRINPYIQAIDEAQATANEQEMREAHPDLDNLTQDFLDDGSDPGAIQIQNSQGNTVPIRSDSDIYDWVQSQPAYLRDGYTRALLEGEPSDVIDVLNRYKQDRGLAPANNQESKPAQQKAKKATAVKGRSGGPPKGRAEGFNDAFAEAVRKNRGN